MTTMTDIDHLFLPGQLMVVGTKIEWYLAMIQHVCVATRSTSGCVDCMKWAGGTYAKGGQGGGVLHYHAGAPGH